MSKFYKSDRPTTAPGYYVPAGEAFPFDGKPNKEWDEVKGPDAAAITASEDRVPDDANLEAASKAALEAVAIIKHVDIRELKSKEDLITAIKAAYEPKL